MLLTLWRRAPAWRLLLFAGAAFTTLAVMFPPPGRNTAPDPKAHFALPLDRVPTAMGTEVSPPLGTVREGVVPFAGHQLPLPAGQWRMLALGRDEGAQPKQVFVLARVRGTQLAGLLVVLAPDALTQAGGFLATPTACSTPGMLAGETVPVPAGQSPFLHECWTLETTRMQTAAGAGPKGGLLQRGAAQLAAIGVAMPDRMLELRYIRSTEFGWFLQQLYLPVRPDGSAGPQRAMVAWARRYVALLHRGFDGGLVVGQPTPALPREPG